MYNKSLEPINYPEGNLLAHFKRYLQEATCLNILFKKEKYDKKTTLILILLVFTNATANAEEETRQYVKFPPKLQAKQLSNMRDHMAAINEILECLAFDELEKAASVAEKRLGLSARHAHSTGDLAKYMPKGMKQAGYNMHSAATHFAQVAKKEDLESAYEALIAVTQSCVECHAGYRTR